MAGSSMKAAPTGSSKTKASRSGAAAKKTAARKAGAATPASAPATVKRDAFCPSLAQRRTLAKDAMWASLAVLTVTAFTGVRKSGPSRSLHIASGAALIGLALWHHTLYGKKVAQCPAPEL